MSLTSLPLLIVSAAVASAISFVEGAMTSSFKVGRGSGPLNHHHSIVQRPLPLYVTTLPSVGNVSSAEANCKRIDHLHATQTRSRRTLLKHVEINGQPSLRLIQPCRVSEMARFLGSLFSVCCARITSVILLRILTNLSAVL